MSIPLACIIRYLSRFAKSLHQLPILDTEVMLIWGNFRFIVWMIFMSLFILISQKDIVIGC